MKQQGECKGGRRKAKGSKCPGQKRTPLQQTPTWPGPPTDPPAEVNEMEVGDEDISVVPFA